MKQPYDEQPHEPTPLQGGDDCSQSGEASYRITASRLRILAENPLYALNWLPDEVLDADISKSVSDPSLVYLLRNHHVHSLRVLRQFTAVQLAALPFMGKQSSKAIIQAVTDLCRKHDGRLPDLNQAVAALINCTHRSLAIYDLDLDRITIEALSDNGIHHVSDLRHCSTSFLLSCPGISRDQVIELIVALRQHESVLCREYEFALLEPTPRATSDFFDPSNSQLIRQLVFAMFDQRTSPLFVADLADNDRLFSEACKSSPINVNPLNFLGVALPQLLQELHLVEIDRKPAIARAPQSTIDRLPLRCWRILNRHALKIVPTRDEVSDVVRGECSSCNLPELGSLVSKLVWTMVGSAKASTLYKELRPCDRHVVSVLTDSQLPLSLKQIINLVFVRFGKKYRSRTIKNSLGRVALRITATSWGLFSHTGISAREFVTIRRCLEQSVIERAPMVCSRRQLPGFVSQVFPRLSADSHQHLLESILSTSRRVKRAGKYGWQTVPK